MERIVIDQIPSSVVDGFKSNSILTLPNNPSGAGYSAEEIKRRMYQSTIGCSEEIVTRINAVITQTNSAIESAIGVSKEYTDSKLGNKVIVSSSEDLTGKNPNANDIVIIEEENNG